MKAIFRFANGATEATEACGELFPDTFQLHAKEGCTFLFEFVEQLPSGTILYQEIPRPEVE